MQSIIAGCLDATSVKSRENLLKTLLIQNPLLHPKATK
jgi:hypothetical protein